MKIFYVYKFNITKDKVNTYKTIVDFLKNENKQYSTMVNIHFYEFETENLRGYKKELLNNNNIKEYLEITDYDQKRMREIRLKNIPNMDEKEIYCIISKATNDIFYTVTFNHINWFNYMDIDDKYGPFNNITINKTYNGVFVELWFEINSIEEDYDYYIKRFSAIIGLKYCERETKTYLTKQEKEKYRVIDAEFTNLFYDIQSKLKLDFMIEQTQETKKIVFVNVLKKILKDTQYIYVGWEGGSI